MGQRQRSFGDARGSSHRLGALLALLALACQLMSCGAAASQVVVRVGDTTITKAELERWTAIEGAVVYNPNPTRPVPQGAVPDPPSYARCIHYLRTTATESAGQLKRSCEQQHLVLQNQVLEILITTKWLTTEASARGVDVSQAEAHKVLGAKFRTQSALRRFLTFTGEREADETFLLKRTMLADRMTASFSAHGVSPAQAQAAQAAFFQRLVQKWTALTSCEPGYVISQCRQHVST